MKLHPLMFLLIFWILVSFLLMSRAEANDISIYDNPSDKMKVTVEVVDNSNKSHKLILDKSDLEKRYPEIESWMLTVLSK